MALLVALMTCVVLGVDVDVVGSNLPIGETLTASIGSFD